MNINDVAEVIVKTAPIRASPIIIGLEGFGGSGKTTLAEQLQVALGKAYTIHIDDFIVKSKLAEPAWDTGVFDHDRLAEQVLKPAVAGVPITYQKLLYAADRLSESIPVPAIKYVIIEGISCYSFRLAQYYDFKIWIDTPIQVARQRGQDRDGTHGSAKDWATWAQIDITYQQKYHPEQQADFTVTND